MNDEVNTRHPDIIWEHYQKTEFGNNLYIGHNTKTKEYHICSDGPPWFCVPGDKIERVESQAKFMLEAYKKYLTTLCSETK